jgi:hypothetical protein
LGGNYIPDQLNVIKVTESTSIELKKKSFSDDFDLRLYTDLAGLSRNSPNGLIQTEGRYNIVLNSAPILDVPDAYMAILGYGTVVGFLSPSMQRLINPRHGMSSNQAAPFYWLSSWLALNFLSYLNHGISLSELSPFIGFSRLEDKSSLSVLASSANSNPGVFTVAPIKTFDLFKYSNLILGADLVLTRVAFTSLNLDLAAHVSAGIYRTPIDTISDSTSHKPLASSLNLLSWYTIPEIVLKTIFSEQIDFDLRYGMLYSVLHDTKPQEIFNDIRTTIQGGFIHKFQFNFNIFPSLSDRSSWLFLRSTLYVNGSDSNLSLQIGYSTSFSKLTGAAK